MHLVGQRRALVNVTDSVATSRRVSPVEHALVLAVYLLATAFFLRPLPAHLDDRDAFDVYDASLVTSILEWERSTLLRDPAHLFQAPWLAPRRDVLALSDHSIGLLPCFALFRAVGASPSASHNLMLWLAIALSGWSTYLLASELGAMRSGAFLAGAAVAFGEFRMDHLFQLQVQAGFFIPLCLRALHRWLTTGRRSSLAAATVWGIWQALCTWYYAFALAVAVAVVLASHAIVKGEPRTQKYLGPLVIATLVALAILAPFALPYWHTHQSNLAAFSRSIEEIERMSASGTDFLPSVSNGYLWGRWADRFPHPSDFGHEHRLFPGLLLMVMAAAGARAAWRRASLRWLVIVPIAMGILTLGPKTSLGIPLPYAVFYRWFPGISGLRAVTRCWEAGMVALAALASLGWTRIFERTRRPWLVWAIAAVGCAEYLYAPIPTVPVGPFDSFQAAANVLRNDPRPGSVLEMSPILWTGPKDARGRSEMAAMERQRMHGRRIVNGYMGFPLPSQDELYGDLRLFPDARSRADLSALGVSHVVVRADRWEGAIPLTAWAKTQWLHSISGDFGPYRIFAFDPERVSTDPSLVRVTWSAQNDPPSGPENVTLSFSASTPVFLGTEAPLKVRWTLVAEGSQAISGRWLGVIPMLVDEGGRSTVLSIRLPTGNGRSTLRGAIEQPFPRDLPPIEVGAGR